MQIKIKINGKEYELTPDGERKPTDNIEIDINLNDGKDSSGYIDGSTIKVSADGNIQK